jgi:ligand-binding sensor domain-containing protein
MKKVLFYFVEFFLVLLIYSPAYSQNPGWINYTSGKWVTALAEENNYIWVGTSGGLVKIDKNSGSPTFYNKVNSGLPDNYITSIAIDGSSNKWIGTYEGGFAKFDGTNWTTYNNSNSGLHTDMVRSIAIDEKGNKWIGTYYGLLA